jgi:coenzyme PQQ precursor peptide PqqA
MGAFAACMSPKVAQSRPPNKVRGCLFSAARSVLHIRSLEQHATCLTAEPHRVQCVVGIPPRRRARCLALIMLRFVIEAIFFRAARTWWGGGQSSGAMGVGTGGSPSYAKCSELIRKAHLCELRRPYAFKSLRSFRARLLSSPWIRRRCRLAPLPVRPTIFNAATVPPTWSSLMTWKTPKIVEVPVGMEINMYACATRK